MNILKCTIFSFILLSLISAFEVVPFFIHIENSNLSEHLNGIIILLATLVPCSIGIMYLGKTTHAQLSIISETKLIKGFIIILLFIIMLAKDFVNIPFLKWQEMSNLFFDTNFLISKSANNNFEISHIYKFIAVLIISPIVEEIIFRFYFLEGLLNKYSLGVSLIISSLCFAFMHIGNLVNVIPAFFLGLISGYVFVKTKKIIYAILLHFFANLIWFISTIFKEEHETLLRSIGQGFVFWTLFLLGIVVCIILLKMIPQKHLKNNHISES